MFLGDHKSTVKWYTNTEYTQIMYYLRVALGLWKHKGLSGPVSPESAFQCLSLSVVDRRDSSSFNFFLASEKLPQFRSAASGSLNSILSCVYAFSFYPSVSS